MSEKALEVGVGERREEGQHKGDLSFSVALLPVGHVPLLISV